MKVLIIDDDAVTRQALQRLLIRHFHCAVTECENGLEGLELLEQQAYTFVVLDVKMPVLSGVETLRALRQSPRHGAVPVVMVSAVRDDESVGEVIRLGISDYLTKPLRPERVVHRLTRVIQSLGRHARQHTDGNTERLRPDDERPLVLVEGNADFRHSFVSTLAPHYPVVEVALGTTALKLCLETPPCALFVGGDIGVLTSDMLVRKLRELPSLDETRIFQIVAPASAAGMPVSRAYDGTLVRTYVPDVLIEHVRRLLGVAPNIDDGPSLLRVLRGQLVSSVEQAFGMMLGIDAEWQDARQDDGVGDHVAASVDLGSLDERLKLQLTLDAPIASAERITARLLGSDEELPVTLEDRCSSISELANVIGGRLQNRLHDFGLPARCSLPRAGIARGSQLPTAGTSESVCLRAAAPSHGITIRVQLMVPAAAESTAA